MKVVVECKVNQKDIFIEHFSRLIRVCCSDNGKIDIELNGKIIAHITETGRVRT